MQLPTVAHYNLKIEFLCSFYLLNKSHRAEGVPLLYNTCLCHTPALNLIPGTTKKKTELLL